MAHRRRLGGQKNGKRHRVQGKRKNTQRAKLAQRAVDKDRWLERKVADER